MKILILAVLLPFFAAAQTPGFSISGKIGNLNKTAAIHLDYMDDGASHSDSVLLVNGAFNFSGHVNGIASVRITLDHTGEGKQASIFKGGDNIYFFLDNE